MGTSLYTGKTVWITGASSGIGAALVHHFAALGARVVLSARNLDRLVQVRSSAGLDASNSWVLPLDLAQPEQAQHIAQQALKTVGAVDLLINNGGISQRSLALETTLPVVRELMEVNYFGTVALTQAVLPQMIARGGGHIVVVSSLVGKFGTPVRSAYSASKHALHGYFDSLRAELPETIGVTILCPGFINTDLPLHARTADGTPQGKMDQAQLNGMTADRFAQLAVRAIQRKKLEAYIGGRETLGVQLKRFFPTLFSKQIRRVRVT